MLNVRLTRDKRVEPAEQKLSGIFIDWVTYSLYWNIQTVAGRVNTPEDDHDKYSLIKIT